MNSIQATTNATLQCPDSFFYDDPMLMVMARTSSIMDTTKYLREDEHVSEEKSPNPINHAEKREEEKVPYYKIKRGDATDPDILLKDLIDEYEKEKVKPVERTEKTLLEFKKYSNQKNYISCMRSTFKDLFNIKACDVDPESLRAWAEKYKEKTGFKASSINRSVTNLRILLRWASEEKNIITIYNLTHFKCLKEINGEYNEPRALKQTEVEKIFETLLKREDGIRLKAKVAATKGYNKYRIKQHEVPEKGFVDYLIPFFATSILTGGRNGSVAPLRWKDIDFKNNKITFQSCFSKTGKTVVTPMTEDLHLILWVWAEQKEVDFENISNDDRFVFISNHQKENKPIVEMDKKTWKKVMEDAGLVPFRWHDLRHTFASRLYENGERIKVISKLLGHSSTRTTERYLHIQPESCETAIFNLDKSMSIDPEKIKKIKHKKKAA